MRSNRPHHIALRPDASELGFYLISEGAELGGER